MRRIQALQTGARVPPADSNYGLARVGDRHSPVLCQRVQDGPIDGRKVQSWLLKVHCCRNRRGGSLL